MEERFQRRIQRRYEQLPDLRLMNYKGWQTLFSSDLDVRPIFQDNVTWRTTHKLATNVCVTGEPGIGKSYEAVDICRVFEGLYANSKGEIVDRFKLKQVVFTHSGYMELILQLPLGKPIVFDEPSYAMGKRDWFKDIQKVLVHTLESQRFLVHPLFIPIINMSLLDKTIRAYLIQFQIHVVGRGHGLVYRLKPSQATDKVYRIFMCELYYHLFDSHLCNRDSCLGCKKLGDAEDPRPGDCQIFRARYERKKKSTQFVRYEQAKDQALQKESQDLTEKQIEEILMPKIEQLLNERSGKLDVSRMRVFLRGEGILISTWKAYQIKGNIEAAHPEIFEDS